MASRPFAIRACPLHLACGSALCWQLPPGRAVPCPRGRGALQSEDRKRRREESGRPGEREEGDICSETLCPVGVLVVSDNTVTMDLGSCLTPGVSISTSNPMYLLL